MKSKIKEIHLEVAFALRKIAEGRQVASLCPPPYKVYRSIKQLIK